MADESKDFNRAFPYGFKRSEAKKNPRQFVEKLESTLARKLNKPSKEGSWVDKKKTGAGTMFVRKPKPGGSVVALEDRDFPAITKGKTRVSQSAANVAANALGGTPRQQKRNIMMARAEKSIGKGKMYKAGRQITKAAVYKNRGG